MVYDLGPKLRVLREKKEYSQKQVADMLEIGYSTMSGYENSTKEPSLKNLLKLARFYGVSTDYLLSLQDYPCVSLEGITADEEYIIKLLIEKFRKNNESRSENL